MGVVAKGAGQVLYSVPIPASCVPALVTVECDRLEASSADPAGGPDADGLDLHLRFIASRAALNQKSDDADPTAVYEFDATPEVLLSRCGTLYLVGGAGLYRASLSLPERWPYEYVQQWRNLTRRLARATDFRVPRGHTMIGSHNTAAEVNVDGDLLFLDGAPKGIASGTLVRSTTINMRLFTACYF